MDAVINRFDRALRTLTGGLSAERASPAAGLREAALDEAERKHAAGLIRVNHTGEACAQALYEGQAMTARNEQVRTRLLASAGEESDHLAWCAERLVQLDARPSLLNPLFYAASYALGAVTGLIGDKVSLGFVEATEIRCANTWIATCKPCRSRTNAAAPYLPKCATRKPATALPPWPPAARNSPSR